METKQNPLIGAIWGAVAWGGGWRGQGGKQSWECVGEAALPAVGISTRWGEARGLRRPQLYLRSCLPPPPQL